MNIKIKKTKAYKKALDYLIDQAPKGVYSRELRKHLKPYEEDTEAIIHYLKSRNVVSLDYEIMKDPNLAGMGYLIWPNINALLEIRDETFWKTFFKKFKEPSTIFSLIAIIISILSFLFTYVWK